MPRLKSRRRLDFTACLFYFEDEKFKEINPPVNDYFRDVVTMLEDDGKNL